MSWQSCLGGYTSSQNRAQVTSSGDRPGCNTVLAEQDNVTLSPHERQYWVLWAEAAKRISEFWQAEERSSVPEFLLV